MRAAPHALYFDSVSNSLFVGGQYKRVFNGDTIVGIGQYKNGQWFRMGDGVDWLKSFPWCTNCIPNPVNSIIRYKDTIYITGMFLTSGNYTVNGIAKWNGTKWLPLKTGLKDSDVGPGSGIGYKFKIYNNDLYLTGAFDSVCGVAAHSLAKFDGVNWSAVNNLPRIYPTNSNFVYDVEFFNGEIYAGGIMDNGTTLKDIVKWNGTAWVNPGIGMYGLGYIRGITIYKNNLYVIGSYSYYNHPSNPGNCIVRYDGFNWQSVGTGMLFAPNGLAWLNAYKIYKNKLYLGGEFDLCNNAKMYSIVTFDGSNFCSLDTTTYFNKGVDCIEFYHDSLYVGGYLKSGTNGFAISLARCINYNYTDKCSASGVGIKEVNNLISNLNVYPNPVSNTLFISPKQDEFKNSEIEITNALGQIVLKLPYSNEIDVSKLAQGFYNLKISEPGEQFYYSKFIKE